jgi:hypothetical protein
MRLTDLPPRCEVQFLPCGVDLPMLQAEWRLRDVSGQAWLWGYDRFCFPARLAKCASAIMVRGYVQTMAESHAMFDCAHLFSLPFHSLPCLPYVSDAFLTPPCIECCSTSYLCHPKEDFIAL